MSNMAPHKGKDLLSLIQSGFPLENRPFRVIGERIECTEKEVIEAIRQMIDDRAIREFGPVFDARKLGYVSTLVAVKAPRERIPELAASMFAVNEITHNYYRDCEYNLWFTITARDGNAIDDIVRWTEKFSGVSSVLDLPVERVFKINAVFGAAAHEKRSSDSNIVSAPVTVEERDIIRTLQKGLPIVEQPFLDVAAELGQNEAELIEYIQRRLADGVIRRFGARVNHRRAGYVFNTLVAWEGKEVHSWGGEFAKLPSVSHCYLRRSYPEWPYRLYTMAHAEREEEMQETLDIMRRIAPNANVKIMKTLYELKKTSMKYFLER